MAALYDGNGDRIFRLDYRKNSDYVSNKAGTAENVYYPTSSVNSAYDTDVILNEMLIPNGVTQNTAINYELTGYINDINTEYTQTLMEFGANGNTTNVYEYGAQRNSATINGTKGYYLYDGRGSVAGLTGSNSGSMITYRYDAYGNTTKSNNTLNNPYQYNAEYTDSSTGLQYLRARYYDSSQGRFTAKDTYLGEIEYPLSRNLYAYCYNNPLNYTDPSGHFGILATLAIGAAIGAVVGGATNAIVQKVTTGTVDWKQVGISAAAGALGGLVGGAFGAVTGAIIGAVSGGTVSAVTTGAITGVVSGVSGGMASRGVYTALDNHYHGTNNSVVKSIFNPTAMLFDAILGGSLGAIQGGIASGKIKNPFSNSSGTKGEQSSFRAWLNSLKKSCGENGNAHVDTQTVKNPVKVPTDDFIEQVNNNFDDVIESAKQSKRPSWRQSELDIENKYPDYKPQESFKNSRPADYGDPGSSRPELYSTGNSIEVKNYNLQTKSGQNNLINNVSKQILQRNVNLPKGTKQTIIIDIRGQELTGEILENVKNGIINKSGTNVDVLFYGG